MKDKDAANNRVMPDNRKWAALAAEPKTGLTAQHKRDITACLRAACANGHPFDEALAWTEVVLFAHNRQQSPSAFENMLITDEDEGEDSPAHFQWGAPEKPADRRARAKKIETALRKARELLEETGKRGPDGRMSQTMVILLREALPRLSKNNLGKLQSFQSVLDKMVVLEEAAQQVAIYSHNANGRPADSGALPPKRIRQLGAIYAAATGQHPTNAKDGNFVRFVFIVCGALGILQLDEPQPNKKRRHSIDDKKRRQPIDGKLTIAGIIKAIERGLAEAKEYKWPLSADLGIFGLPKWLT